MEKAQQTVIDLGVERPVRPDDLIEDSRGVQYTIGKHGEHIAVRPEKIKSPGKRRRAQRRADALEWQRLPLEERRRRKRLMAEGLLHEFQMAGGGSLIAEVMDVSQDSSSEPSLSGETGAEHAGERD
jgi:hypothetical protein